MEVVLETNREKETDYHYELSLPMHEVEELEESGLLKMDLLWLLAVEMKSSCHTILSLLNDTSTVVYLLMMAEEHMIKQALSLHAKLTVDSHFLLSTPSNRQYPIGQFEEKLIGVVSNNGDLLVGSSFCKDSSK